MPIPPTAAPLTSIQESVIGSELTTDFKKVWASSIVYGCGKRSRNAIQTLRLFACLTMDSASSIRHGRMVHRFRISRIVFLSESIESSAGGRDGGLSAASLPIELNTHFLHLAIRQQPNERFV